MTGKNPRKRLLRLAATLAGLAGLLPTQLLAKELDALTKVTQVRALPSEQAARGVPVRIRGQVLLLSGWKNSFFFSDGHFGISVDRNDVSPALHSGDTVEITGKTSAGLFAPIIVSDQVRVLGNANLPPAPLRDYSELAGGSEDSQWVRVRGIVHAAWIAPSWGKKVLFLIVNRNGVNITARVNDFTVTDPSYLVDAEVVLTGVCGTNFNEARQFVGLRLFVAGMDAVEIEKAAPPDPFGQAPQALENVRRFGPRSDLDHRIRVAGTVTYQKAGYGLYVQQDKSALFLQTAQNTVAAVGTKIDAIGFAASGPYSPRLDAASFRILGHGDQTPPANVQPGDIIRTNADGFVSSFYDGMLVTLRGRLLDRVSGAKEEALAMGSGQTLFRALLAKPASKATLPAIRIGSELAVTGVVSVIADKSGEPYLFVLQLRSPGDVSVVQTASWWDRRRTGYALWVVALVAMGGLIGVAHLRRKVAQQALVVRQSLEIHRLNAELEARVTARTAELTEANREMEAFTYTAAHDLRAPLRHINGFAEILRETWFDRMDDQGRRFLTKIAVSSEQMGVLLDDLLNFTRLSRLKIQPGRVALNQLMMRIKHELEPDWEGRAVTWETGDLPEVVGDPHLLHQVFFNLLANAVKYTRNCPVAHIEIGCQNGVADKVTVWVRDNGVGFEMEYVDKLFHVFQRLHKAQDFEGSGIGLAVVRRIVEGHGGGVRAEGAPGQGAAFYISLPVQGNHGKAGLHSVGGR